MSNNIGSANYYLGVIALDSSDYVTAIKYFEIADNNNSDRDDLRAKVLIAEAYAMQNYYKDATDHINKIYKGINDIKSKYKRKNLRTMDLTLQSRARLIEANILITKRADGWEQEVVKLLQPSLDEDPESFRICVTLSQAYASMKDQSGNQKAKKLFLRTLQLIDESWELQTVREIRTKIFLQMVAGLCCQQAPDNDKVNSYLDSAEVLRNSLPMIDNQACTVFSILSKKNERSDTIHHHIEKIREGALLF